MTSRASVLISFAISALALTANANWSTNAWPSYDHVRDLAYYGTNWLFSSEIRQIEIYRAIEERDHAILFDAAPTNDYTNIVGRSERDNCIRLKARTVEILHYFVNTNVAWDPCSSNPVPVWNASSILQHFGYRSNFWTYTPWRFLDQHTIPATNAYGWNNLKTILDEMTITSNAYLFYVHMANANTNGSEYSMEQNCGLDVDFNEKMAWIDAACTAAVEYADSVINIDRGGVSSVAFEDLRDDVGFAEESAIFERSGWFNETHVYLLEQLSVPNIGGRSQSIPVFKLWTNDVVSATFFAQFATATVCNTEIPFTSCPLDVVMAESNNDDYLFYTSDGITIYVAQSVYDPFSLGTNRVFCETNCSQQTGFFVDGNAFPEIVYSNGVANGFYYCDRYESYQYPELTPYRSKKSVNLYIDSFVTPAFVVVRHDFEFDAYTNPP